MESHAATRLGFRKWTTKRSLQAQCRFSSVFCCRNSSSPIARISPGHAFLGIPRTESTRHCRARTRHSADLGGCHLFEMLQQRAERGRGALLGAPVPAGSNVRCPNGQGGFACAWSGMRSPHSVPDSRLSQGSKLFTSWSYLVDQMPWKRRRSWTADAVCRLDADCVPVGDSEQEIDFPWALIQRRTRRRCHTVLTAFSVAGEYLRALSVRRSLSQQAAPSGKPSVQDGLASSVRCCRYRMRDPTDSRTRHLSPVQRVRTSQLGERPTLHRLLPAPEPDTITQREGATNSTPTLCHSSHGSYFGSSSFLIVRTSLADPLVGISSPHAIGSLSGEPQRPSASSCRSRSCGSNVTGMFSMSQNAIAKELRTTSDSGSLLSKLSFVNGPALELILERKKQQN